MDTVRVLRIIEYVGPRDAVEKQILNSVHGERQWGAITMRAATIGTFPEILDNKEPQ